MVTLSSNPKICVVGGCGHVGLPLAVVFASTGLAVTSFDVNNDAVIQTNSGIVPFWESGLDEALREELKSGRFSATSDPTSVSQADIVVVVIGTPVDKHLNPDPNSIRKVFEDLDGYLKNGQLIVLRSTIYPGVTKSIESFLAEKNLDVHIAFCPERIAEGHALEELRSLPQIIGARTPEARQRAVDLFERIVTKVVHVSPEEAELAKLFTNSWRYIKFAAANQLFMMANDFGVDFEQVREAITFDYPRAADLPGPGFAAGPCLLKDTMQLAAFNNNQFTLGHTSMMINEGLPMYVISRAEQQFELSEMTVGILGMAFKGESDDTRSSLAYKLRHILNFKAKNVLSADTNVKGDRSLIDEVSLVELCDLIFIGAPHKRYRSIQFTCPVVDIWNVCGNGVLI
jgi:UDP-N-acetyl-D-mannosaminuronic acid dehydrogenase